MAANLRAAAVPGSTLLGVITWFAVACGARSDVAVAAPFMGDCKLDEARTYTVSVDPDLTAVGLTYDDVLAAFGVWNNAFEAEYGIRIFETHAGNWQHADILLTAHGDTITWVNTRCNQGFVRKGNNLAVIHIGADFNKRWLAHELGHVLGLSDYVYLGTNTTGYLSPGVCDVANPGTPSIMSACRQIHQATRL